MCVSVSVVRWCGLGRKKDGRTKRGCKIEPAINAEERRMARNICTYVCNVCIRLYMRAYTCTYVYLRWRCRTRGARTGRGALSDARSFTGDHCVRFQARMMRYMRYICGSALWRIDYLFLFTSPVARQERGANITLGARDIFHRRDRIKIHTDCFLFFCVIQKKKLSRLSLNCTNFRLNRIELEKNVITFAGDSRLISR